MADRLDPPIEQLLREMAPQVLSPVVRRFRDFAAAEDAVQEALIAATEQWPRDGVPANPRGWLIQVASRRMTDHIRSEVARRRREQVAAEEAERLALQVEGAAETVDDDTLERKLAIARAYPALKGEVSARLDHTMLDSLSNSHELAVESGKVMNATGSEATMAQRISRAKQSTKESGIPFQLPTAEDRAQRLRAVLHVLYLIFNEGYASSAGPQLRRADLSDEAIRLMRIVYDLQPDNTEVAGLLALMLLTDARRAARTGPEELVPLAQQNRALWDRQQIAEGIALLSAALPKGAVGPYQLQAAIAAVHDEAARTEDTDWPQILALYELLKHMSDNPMIVLNHAVAAAMVHGPRKGLELLNALDSDPRLAERHRLEAVRAHLLEMAGEHEAAITNYRNAASRATSLPERNYLMMQAARLSDLRRADQ